MESTYYKNFKLLCRILAPCDIDDDSPGLSREIKTVDWEVLLPISDAYFVFPALYISLKRKQVLESLDNEVSDCLEGIYELNCHHNELIKSEALTVIRLLNTKQIQPVLLKGIAGLMTGLYEEDGERIIGDIDLLIDLSELSTALKVLLDHGYCCENEICRQVFSSTFYTHELTIMTKSRSVKIDLHVRPTGSSGEKAFVSTKGARRQAELLEEDGASFLLPSPLFRLMHNFYHSQYLDRSYIEATINLRQLIDWVTLWRRYGGQVSVPEMEKKLVLHAQARSLRLYALSAERYLGAPLPAGIEVGWFERLLFQRQKLVMQYRWMRVVNGALTCVLSGVQLIIPERIRLTHGDLPLWRLIGLRAANFFDPHWYRRRFEDIKKVLGR